MARSALHPSVSPGESAVLTKAVLRAAERLGLTSRALAAVLGVSEATVSRMKGGAHRLAADQKAAELAVLLVRLYRSLDAVVGGEDRVAAAWLRAENTALGAPPAALIRTVAGLVHVIAYLDARRAVL